MIEIGQRVKVCRVRDRISSDLVEKIKKNPTGVVDNYKILDGKNLGVVVKFDDQFATWFFEDELEAV